VFKKLYEDDFYNFDESVLITPFSFDITFSPYRAVNTLRFSYTNQSVNVV
jgi:hypothetical protein